MILAVALARQL